MADKDELLDHDYDGIQEYDNDLPRWWVNIFWLTALFAVVRVGYYHFGPGLLQYQRLAVEMSELEATRAASAAKAGAGVSVTEAGLLALTKDTAALKKGAEVFTAKCVACHLEHGQGLVGPNLTDDYWIHGGKLMDMHKVVTAGVLDKGMLAWKGVISDDEINSVVAYIWTLHGTNPPNPKAPQGDLAPRS